MRSKSYETGIGASQKQHGKPGYRGEHLEPAQATGKCLMRNMIFHHRKNQDSCETRAYSDGNRLFLPVIIPLGTSLPPEHEFIRAPNNETE